MNSDQTLFPTEWQTEWGQLLRVARQVAGMTLAELSGRSGISKGYLSKLESGHVSARNPSRATLAGLARALPGLAPLAHMLGPEQAGPVVALEQAITDLPAYQAPGQPRLLRLGWRELELLAVLLTLRSASIPLPCTMPVLARALRRSTDETVRIVGKLIASGLVVRRPPHIAGGVATFTLSNDFEEQTGIGGLADLLVVSAALFVQGSQLKPHEKQSRAANWGPLDDLASAQDA